MSVLNIKSDDLFRQIALGYAESLGKELKKELAVMEENPALVYAVPGLDRKVLGEIAAHKRRRNFRVVGALAACLLLVLLIPGVLNRGETLSTAPQAAPSAGSAASARAQEEAAAKVEEDAVEAPAAEAAPSEDMNGDISMGGSGIVTGGGAALIPLSFALPENLSVIAVEQDNEKSVYYLSDVNWDDVVLTLEESVEEPDTEGLAVYRLGDFIAWGTENPDYKLLTFTQEGVRYEMTCKYSMDTLVTLWEQIV